METVGELSTLYVWFQRWPHLQTQISVMNLSVIFYSCPDSNGAQREHIRAVNRWWHSRTQLILFSDWTSGGLGGSVVTSLPWNLSLDCQVDVAYVGIWRVCANSDTLSYGKLYVVALYKFWQFMSCCKCWTAASELWHGWWQCRAAWTIQLVFISLLSLMVDSKACNVLVIICTKLSWSSCKWWMYCRTYLLGLNNVCRDYRGRELCLESCKALERNAIFEGAYRDEKRTHACRTFSSK